MDRHILNALFAPTSIVVFAGDPDAAEAPTPMAATLRKALAEGAFKGPVFWLDAAMSGTLSDLAHSRADLALIALPDDDILAALEIVGRLRCRSAAILSLPLPDALRQQLADTARRHGVHLLGPSSLGFQRPALGLNASVLGPLARPGALGLFGYSFLDAHRAELSASPIEQVTPAAGSIADGRYPISRPLYFYVKKAQIGHIPGIVEYIEEFTRESAWGDQGYLLEKGLVPLPQDQRRASAASARQLELMKM